jgi:hypothetical protein
VTQGSKTRWSFAEDRRLIQLATSLKSVEAIATKMRRTPANVVRMAKRLGVSLKSAEGEEMSPSKPARRPWTADERKKLDDLLKAGKTGPEIAAALQRTPQSIYSQLQRLGIKRKKAGRRVVQLGLKAKK